MVDRSPASVLQEMIDTFPGARIAPVAISKKMGLGVADSLRKFDLAGEKYKNRPLGKCHKLPMSCALKKRARVGGFVLKNTALKSYHLCSVRSLRRRLNLAESELRNLAADLGWVDFDLEFWLDDIEGFYTNCPPMQGYEATKQVFSLYHLQCPAGSPKSSFCWVSSCKTKPVLPGDHPLLKMDSSYSEVYLDDVLTVCLWMLKYFTLVFHSRQGPSSPKSGFRSRQPSFCSYVLMSGCYVGAQG